MKKSYLIPTQAFHLVMMTERKKSIIQKCHIQTLIIGRGIYDILMDKQIDRTSLTTSSLTLFKNLFLHIFHILTKNRIILKK